MKSHTMLAAGKLACPKFWARFIHEFLAGDVLLAKELWQQLYPSQSQPIMYQLSRIQDLGGQPQAIIRFGQLAKPQLLLTLCARLAPEDGRQRREDVRLLEESILQRTGPDGQWV
jgi:hypothetical protein